MITLETLNELLRHAKAANNYLRSSDPEVTAGRAFTATVLYTAIVAVEDELRADGGLEWDNGDWVLK